MFSITFPLSPHIFELLHHTGMSATSRQELIPSKVAGPWATC